MNRLTLIIFELAILFFLAFSANGMEPEKDHFSILAMPTLMDVNIDAWYKIPQNSGPQIYNTEKVFRGQEFSIQVLFNHYAAENNAVDITYDVNIFDPDGNKTEDSSSNLQGYKSQKPAGPVLLLNQQFMVVYFTKENDYGKYKFEVIATDNIANKTTSTNFEVALIPFEPVNIDVTKQVVSDWMSDYYVKNNPELAIQVVKQFIEADSDWANEHLLTVTFLEYVFSKNHYLWDYVAQHFDQMSQGVQNNFILIDALATNSILTQLVPGLEENKIYDLADIIKLPTMTSEITNAYQMDANWALFFASGKIEPIQSIIRTFEFHESIGVLDKLKNKTMEKTEQSQQRAYEEALLKAAIWSLKSNSKKHPLVFKYAVWIYQNIDMSKEAKVLLYSVLKSVQQETQAKND